MFTDIYFSIQVLHGRGLVHVSKAHECCDLVAADKSRKALAKRIRKSTQVNASFRLAFNLRFVWLPTYDDLLWHWPSSNSYPSRRKCFTVWPPNASRHKLIASKLYMRLAWTCEPTCESVWPTIASPYVSSGSANLRRLTSNCESVWPGLKDVSST